MLLSLAWLYDYFLEIKQDVEYEKLKKVFFFAMPSRIIMRWKEK